MSEDWFDFVALPSGRTYIIGSDKHGNQIEIAFEGDIANRIDDLQARHQREMQNLLRELAT